MARGAAVIRRKGKHGITFSIKWRDHDGRQCWERLGRSPQWNETKAQRELGKRLDQVEREQWRKPAESPSPRSPRGSRPTTCRDGT